MRRLVTLGALAAAAVFCPSAAAAEAARLIVGYEPGTSAEERLDARRDADVVLRDRVARVNVDVVAADNAVAAMAQLEQAPEVRFVEPDSVARAFMTDGVPDLYPLAGAGPAVPWHTAQWPLNPPNDPSVYNASRGLDITPLWRVSLGDGVKVAAVDSGIPGAGEAAFSESLPRYWPETTVEPPAGWTSAVTASADFVDPGDGRVDPYGHGTKVLGTIIGREGAPTIGVAPRAQGINARALAANGAGSVSSLAQAMQWAAAQGARVVNGSFGGYGSGDVYRAVIDAYPEVLFVFAAGNDGFSYAAAPCNIDRDNVICVGAAEVWGYRASYSNYSPVDVDLLAPAGVGAPGRFLFNGVEDPYAPFSGTSAAAPHVAGVAALLFARYPEATPQQVRAAILSGAVPAPEPGLSATGGLLDAAGALQRIDTMFGGPTPRVEQSSPATVRPGDWMTLQGMNLRDVDAGEIDGSTVVIERLSPTRLRMKVSCHARPGAATVRARDGANWSASALVTVGGEPATGCPATPGEAQPAPEPPAVPPAPDSEPARPLALTAPSPGRDDPPRTSQRRVVAKVTARGAQAATLHLTAETASIATVNFTRLSCSGRCSGPSKATRRVRLRAGQTTLRLTRRAFGATLSPGRWRLHLTAGETVARASFTVR